jgi:hypothetical protein
MLFRHGSSQINEVDIESGESRAKPVSAVWEDDLRDGPVSSPDGGKLAFTTIAPGTLDGEPGVWRRLRIADGDGGNPRTLVQHFLRDSDIDRYMASFGEDPGNERWRRDLVHWVGPSVPRWSPLGTHIAFLAALPFDPDGAVYKAQNEVWMYELDTGVLTRLTNNDIAEEFLMWRGPNTYPSDPEVTVGTVTVSFAEVTEPGLTIVSRRGEQSESPSGYRFGGHYYEISTSAAYSGPVAICVTYRDDEAPDGDDQKLSLLRYDEDSGEWEDITTSRDADANVVCGDVDSL